MSQQLDRSKPLWEIWVVEGLEGDRWAILSKAHHCMLDGVAGSDLLSVLMDERPDAEHPPGQRWDPEPRPSALSLLGNSLLDGLRRPREGLRTLRKTLRAPRRLLHDLGDLTEGLATFRKLSKDTVESSLNGPIGPHRRWLWASTTIAEIKKIRDTHGGTLNDVVLSAIALGFRQLLRSRDEPVEGCCVRTLVPVSLRREQERGTFDNRISAMFADLPMDIADPVECLASIRTQMEGLKAHHQPNALETFNALSEFTPPVLLALAARLFAGLEQHAVQTVTTNVPGSRHELYASGRRMLAAYPYVPLTGSVRIGIAIFSYAGHLTFGITGDYETASDIDVLAAGIESAVEELLAMS
jgi:WS/DGAT/MGAT family acyltransferase